MQFHISECQVRKDRRRTLFLLIAMLFFSTVLLARAAQMDKVSDLLLPAVGLLFLAPGIYRSYRLIQQGAAAYPVLTLDEKSRQMALRYQGITVNLDLQKIKNMRLKVRSGHVASIVIKSEARETLRFDGYDNMDLLVGKLVHMVPADKITRASFFH